MSISVYAMRTDRCFYSLTWKCVNINIGSRSSFNSVGCHDYLIYMYILCRKKKKRVWIVLALTLAFKRGKSGEEKLYVTCTLLVKSSHDYWNWCLFDPPVKWQVICIIICKFAPQAHQTYIIWLRNKSYLFLFWYSIFTTAIWIYINHERYREFGDFEWILIHDGQCS